MDFSKLGETKVTVPIILLAALVVFGWHAKDFTIGGLDEFFISEAEGGEIAEAVRKNNELITNYISQQTIKDINREIREIGDEISNTQLWISANGANEIATARLRALVDRRTSLQETKSCLLNDSIANKELCNVE